MFDIGNDALFQQMMTNALIRLLNEYDFEKDPRGLVEHDEDEILKED